MECVHGRDPAKCNACRQYQKKERAAEIEAAAESLLAVACYVDNGYCSICHGYWPNDHREHCQGARLKAALARAKENAK